MRPLQTSLLLGLIWATADLSSAQQNAVNFASPVADIRIDGDLSDWPQDMVRYPISQILEDEKPHSAADYEGHLRIGYNSAENALYLAVDVRDESIVEALPDGEQNYITGLDGCEIFVDLNPADETVDILQYVVWGTRQEHYSGNKKTHQFVESGVPLRNAQVAYQRSARGHVYEWRLDVEKIGGGALHLDDSRGIGVAIIVRDRDADGSRTGAFWCAALLNPLVLYPRSMRPVLLGAENMQWGQIQGQVRWSDNGESVSRAIVYAQSSEHEGLRVPLLADRDGHFTARLPVGTYQLRTAGGAAVPAAVGRGEESLDREYIVERAPPTGTSTPAVGHTRRAGSGIRTGSFRAFGVRDGLQSSSIYQTEEDARGQLWMNTRDGLLRYDGEGFTWFQRGEELPESAFVRRIAVNGTDVWISLSDGSLSHYNAAAPQFTNYGAEDGLGGGIQALLPEDGGRIWLGTSMGLYYFDGERFTRYTTDDGLLSDIVTALRADGRGGLWVGTSMGLSHYDGERFTAIAREDGSTYQVNDLARAGQGALWVATNSGLSRYSGAPATETTPVLQTLTTDDGLPTDQITYVVAARAGGAWAATDSGLVRYDGAQVKTFTTKDGLPSNEIRSLKEDSQGQLWVRVNGGVARYDGTRFTALTTADGLAAETAEHVMEDSQGRIWISSWKGGVTRYDGNQIRNFTRADGLDNHLVHCVLQDRRGRIWLSTARGLNWYEDGQIHRLEGVDGLDEANIWDMVEDRAGQVFFATLDNGVYAYDGRRWAHWAADDGLASNRVAVLLADSQGRVWAGTDKGLSAWDGSRWTTYTTEDGMQAMFIRALEEDDAGDIWIGFNDWGGKIDRFDGETFKHYTSEKDGTLDNSTFSSFKDRDGHLWFGTWIGIKGGVERWDGARFTTLTMDDGLAATGVEAIYQDQRGIMWFGTWGGGISLYDGLVFQTINQHDGLVHDTVQRIIQDQEGYMWIATEGGVTRYKPSTVPPKISLSTTADRTYAEGESIEIDTNQDFVRFELLGSSFTTDAERLVYAYRLRGRDEKWRSTQETSVEYTDLPTGHYTFEVKAVDRDLNYSQPARAEVSVQLPYGRIAAISGLSLSALVIFGLVLRLSKQARSLRRNNTTLAATNDHLDKARRQADAANHAKSQFLANMSHEIRTPMNAILGYAQIMRRSADLAPDHRQAVDTIQTSGDHLLRLINDVLDISKIEAGRMELDPNNFDLRQMLESLGVMFALQCQTKGLSWTLSGLGEKALLVYGDEPKLRQVLINLLGNAVKFTSSGSVSFTLELLQGDRFRFVVEDSGPGMTNEEVELLFQPFQQGAAGHEKGGTGLGLTIAQRQLKLMHGDLDIESTPGTGSRFSFVLRLLPAHGAVQAQDTGGEWSRVKCLAPGSTARILVADDVVENREILRDMLADIGVEVELAKDGQEALEKLDAFAPDLVFFDIRMPVLGGKEALREMRDETRWQQIKAVAISASVLEHERQGYLQAGFDDFIDKPFRFEWICACLSRHLGIEYEYEEAGAEDETSLKEYIDWSGLSLDAEMHTQLREAAEIYSVTDIEDYLREIENQSPAHRKLAEHLRGLKQEQNMDGIIEVLSEIRHA